MTPGVHVLEACTVYPVRNASRGLSSSPPTTATHNRCEAWTLRAQPTLTNTRKLGEHRRKVAGSPNEVFLGAPRSRRRRSNKQNAVAHAALAADAACSFVFSIRPISS